MQQLHVPASVRCPAVDDPLSRLASCPVPYAAALHRVRASQQLQAVARACTSNDEEFVWLDQDNNSATSGKISEQSKQAVAKYNFMYFRIRIGEYRAVLNSLSQVAKSESLFSEEKLRRWTLGYRFRLQKGAPIKSALRAFSCRLGIETDPDIVFCRDGFYGDSQAGSLTSPIGIPYQMLLGDVTAQGCGLTNGSSIFVSRCTQQEREAAAAVLRVMDEDPLDDEEQATGTDSAEPEAAESSPEKSDV